MNKYVKTELTRVHRGWPGKQVTRDLADLGFPSCADGKVVGGYILVSAAYHTPAQLASYRYAISRNSMRQ